MKKQIVVIGLLLMVLEVMAAPITKEQALTVARQWCTQTGAPARRMTAASNQLTVADSSAAYIAVNTPSGFVLVGADDRLQSVLGYSNRGTFAPANLPPALMDLLDSYNDDLAQLSQSRMVVQKELARAASDKSVLPLLKSTWNQSAPFNDLAPVVSSTGSRAAAGCVATAMAQIMYYHKCPIQGKGSHSYLWVCKEVHSYSATLSANFGATTYAWADMLDSYNKNHTAQQDAAVATLLYHCGVSVNMGYGESSGAVTALVPAALKNYFSYDANYQRIQKVMYPIDSLNAIIRAELDQKRPVLVSGQNTEGGHAFVCDGYDVRDYFHINWGWGGSSDGYYLLSALNPRQQGIGGTSRGYNKGTSFYIGLQPAGAATKSPIPQMAADSIHVDKSKLARTGTFTTSVYRLENFGLDDFSGNYGLALYDEDETKLISVLWQSDNYQLRAGYHRTTVASMDKIKIPATIPNGTYHLCAVYRNAQYSWMRLLCTQDDYYKTVYLSSSSIEFYDNNAPAEVALTAPISFPNPDSVPVTGAPLSFSLKNTGGTFRGEISARIYKGAFAKGQYELMDSVVIRRNQKIASALQQVFDANLLVDTDYKMKLCWRANDRDSWHNFTPADYATLTFRLYDPNPPTPTGLFKTNQNMMHPIIIDKGRWIMIIDGKKYTILGQEIH
ncbi:MAG: C10 family peptidase [Paludibacteraceae bacterium]|nr:C10 family peptidase [Paludibacteraceae bacterium]